MKMNGAGIAEVSEKGTVGESVEVFGVCCSRISSFCSLFGGLISIVACQRLDAVNHCISLKLPWLFLIALVAVMGGIYLIFVAYAKVELKKAEILPAIREE